MAETSITVPEKKRKTRRERIGSATGVSLTTSNKGKEKLEFTITKSAGSPRKEDANPKILLENGKEDDMKPLENKELKTIKTKNRSLSVCGLIENPTVKNFGQDALCLLKPASVLGISGETALEGLSMFRNGSDGRTECGRLRRMNSKNRATTLTKKCRKNLLGSTDSGVGNSEKALVIHFMDHSKSFSSIVPDVRLSSFLTNIYSEYDPSTHCVKNRKGENVDISGFLEDVPSVLFCFGIEQPKESSIPNHATVSPHIFFLTNNNLMARCEVFRDRGFQEWLEISSFLGGEGMKSLSLRFEKNLKKRKHTKFTNEVWLQPSDHVLNHIYSEYSEDQAIFGRDSNSHVIVKAARLDVLVEIKSLKWISR
eukprot:TRINITY_DN5157_c0_g1_i15.p2 TRINITY_DN5157_c0_g1~~TRINITY_DN5157_c0_g1_i15.p2  ORF type:complete len:369 (-),score=65.42 TRINITY_DN5157_c0_g1_i15:1240-2346(-)